VAGAPFQPSEANGLTLVIPSHNESENLGRVLEEWWDRRPSGIPYEILVVDDGSTDATAATLERLGSRIPVRWVRNPAALGFGGALRVGIHHTKTPWVAFTDADGQYDARDLPPVLNALSSGSDLAVGRRSPRADPFHRTALSIGFRGLLYAFFGLRSKDPTSSLKAGRTDSVRAVAERVQYMNGSFWNEFMLRWIRAGYAYTEIPVRHLPRASGVSKIAASGQIVRLSVQQFIALLRAWREFHRLPGTGTATTRASPEEL